MGEEQSCDGIAKVPHQQEPQKGRKGEKQMANNGLKKAIAAAGVVGAVMSPMVVMAAPSPDSAETVTDLVESGAISDVQKDADGKVTSFKVEEGIKDGFQYFNLNGDPELVYIKDGAYSKEVSDSANDTADFVNNMFKETLDREVDNEGRDYWVGEMMKDTAPVTGADLIASIVYAPEYVEKQKTNEQIVADMYASMLGRTDAAENDKEGFDYWVGCLNNGMTVQWIVSGFCGSDEFKGICEDLGVEAGTYQSQSILDYNVTRTAFVAGLYQDVLGRAGSEAELTYWVDALTAEENQQTAAQAIGGFVFSKEATSKPVDDDAFVNMLYKVFMGREADAEGLAYWKGQLADGAAREAVFNGFLGSEEFQKVCADSFIAVGDPIPVPTDSVEE
jgi:hypothetical protein